MLPSADILNEFEFGKFVLSNLAAKRAKQLREGAPPLVQIDSNHPLTIALAEIAAGRIKPAVPAAAELIDDGVEVAVLSEDSVPAELGLLLPSLDEVELVPDADDEDADDDSDDEVEDRPVSLSDLADDDDDTEEETVAADGDDETLSLSDIAEQESGDDDENESDD
jgi:DNA-directed RNA polymerase subunit omega